MPDSVDSVDSLVKYSHDCSISELNQLLLSRLNTSSNTEKDFQDQVKRVLREVYRLFDMTEAWAQQQAEARYVNYIRESVKLQHEQLQVTESKVLPISVAKE